ncbi:MAG: hypothetical protein L6R38_003097 [Xanthoria sp. 2 TBL-2021]|nr:MAG: hypothetical protein L6R38_003097 [Xanthoria sp. 2 TBL-2021]
MPNARSNPVPTRGAGYKKRSGPAPKRRRTTADASKASTSNNTSHDAQTASNTAASRRSTGRTPKPSPRALAEFFAPETPPRRATTSRIEVTIKVEFKEITEQAFKKVRVVIQVAVERFKMSLMSRCGAYKDPKVVIDALMRVDKDFEQEILEAIQAKGGDKLGWEIKNVIVIIKAKNSKATIKKKTMNDLSMPEWIKVIELFLREVAAYKM